MLLDISLFLSSVAALIEMRSMVRNHPLLAILIGSTSVTILVQRQWKLLGEWKRFYQGGGFVDDDQ
jgi:hypothetical protein